MMSWPIHFAGYDPQIAQKCTPLERARVWLFGLYLIILVFLGSTAMLYATYVLLGGMGENDTVFETIVELLMGGTGFLLLWNTYRMILLVRMPEPGDDHKTAFSGMLIRQCAAAFVGICVAVVGTLAWVQTADLRKPAEATNASTMRLWLKTEEVSQVALDDLYLLRVQALEERAEGTVDTPVYQRLTQEIIRIDSRIVEMRKGTETRHQLDASRGEKERGFAHQVSAIIEQYHPLNWIVWAIVALLFCAPVMARDMNNKGEYEFRSEMQNIRTLMRWRIIPKARSIPYHYTLPRWLTGLAPGLKSLKFKSGYMSHLHLYLGPKQLLQQTKAQLDISYREGGAFLKRWVDFARDDKAIADKKTVDFN